jgi:NAD-dependent deacetylase
VIERIVILTGAGISADSGVDTFRDPNGVWARYNVEDVATPQGFARNPAMVHDFYNGRRRGLGSVEPNAAHHALARLEAEFPGEILIVTQNVDDLHERAGTRNVIHMHGELARVRNARTGDVFPWRDDLSVDSRCPTTGEVGVLRPHVVWFGEMPLQMDDIAAALDACDLFASIGTSGHVYPAAGFVAEVRMMGHAHTVEINLEPSQGHSQFAETIYGRAADTVPAWVERLLRR